MKMSFRIPQETRDQIESIGDNMTKSIVKAIHLLWMLTAPDEQILASKHGHVERHNVPDFRGTPQHVWCFVYHDPNWKFCIEPCPPVVTRQEDAEHIYATHFRMCALVEVAPKTLGYVRASIPHIASVMFD